MAGAALFPTVIQAATIRGGLTAASSSYYKAWAVDSRGDLNDEIDHGDARTVATDSDHSARGLNGIG